MDEIIDSMTAYVYGRIKTIGMKNLEGMEPEDFVADVLMKVAEGERDWIKAKCPFKDFLFGCLRSHLSNFFKNFEPVCEAELPDVEANNESYGDSELKSLAIQILVDNGADKNEIAVCECWIDGINKPSAVAGQLKKEVKEIYNITKRLERRMPKLKSEIINFV